MTERTADKLTETEMERAVDDARERIGELIEAYAEEEPGWVSKELAEVVRDGLENLRAYIEKPDEDLIGWDAPFVEIRFPVAWDFSREPGGEEDEPNWVAGTLTPDDVVDGRVPDDRLPSIGAEWLRLFALDVATLGVREWRDRDRKPGDHPRYLFPADLQAELDEASGVSRDEEGNLVGPPEALKKRQSLMEVAVRPFCIGVEMIPTGPGGWLPEGLTWEEAKALGKPDAPATPFAWKNPDGPEVLKGKALATIRPLTVDTTEERAWFTVGVGLDFEEGRPETLPPEALDAFWRSLLGEWDETYEKKQRSTKVQAGPPETTLDFVLPFVETKMDRDVDQALQHLKAVQLPKRNNAPRLDELEAAEVHRLLEEMGEDAAREADLLYVRQTATGEKIRRLKADALATVKARAGLGGMGYREVDTDGREWLVRVFEKGAGKVEVSLSWNGLAGPLSEEFREQARARVEEEEQAAAEALYTSERDQKALEAQRRRARGYQDAVKLMEVILGQVVVQRRNLVTIPAEAFRELLKIPETDQRWRERVQTALQLLVELHFRYGSKRYGAFLGEVEEDTRGPGGGRGRWGTYTLDVQPGFLGCLSLFQSNRRTLPKGGELLEYDFAAPPPNGKSLSPGYTRFDSGRAYYNAAEGFTRHQEAVHAFLESEMTLNRSTVRTKPPGHLGRQKITGDDGLEPRVYTSQFCSLLKVGRQYHAALGNYTRNAEAGWTLQGTRKRASKSGGAHTEGLLSRMGLTLPSGRDHRGRDKVYREGFETLKAVVVDYAEGILAGWLDGRWLRFEDAQKLPEPDLKRVRWYPFVPANWKEIRREKWNSRQLEKVERGEGSVAYIAHEDPERARLAHAALQGQATEVPEEGLVLLRHRLHKARVDRGLSQTKVGRVFGVSQKTLSRWELGMDPDEEGKIRGKPIPEAMVPLVERWVETGTEPTTEELAEQASRRRTWEGT